MTTHGKFRFLSADELDRMAWSQKKEYYKSLYDTLREKVYELDDIEREKETSPKARALKNPG